MGKKLLLDYEHSKKIAEAKRKIAQEMDGKYKQHQEEVKKLSLYKQELEREVEKELNINLNEEGLCIDYEAGEVVNNNNITAK